MDGAAAKLLLNSPAVQVLRWAQSQFPAILPGGVVDSHPLDRAAALSRGRLGLAAMKADLPAIELDGVAKRYGAIQAVRDVSFSLPQGERVALVGHNGAGKTTLIKLMLGLIRPSAGRLRVLGEDPAAGIAGARQRLGCLPETVASTPR